MKKLNDVQDLLDDVVAFDAAHLWHPYAAPGVRAFEVTSTKGVYLTLRDGRRLIDGMSSWWAAAYGHGHPRLTAAAHAQIDEMSHVMFGGLTHAPAARLARNLLELTGGEFGQVFYSDSGSVSVEVAIKMALQFARGQGHPERTALLTWRSGYHGDTFGAMSVCDPDGGMHSLWQGVVAQQYFAPPPPVRGSGPEAHAAYLAEMDALIGPDVAAIIIEPVVQGAGGMRFHDPELVRGVRRLCDDHDIVLIADEIATGFGRAGQLFTTLDNGVVPDILCVGKALTGGFMSLAATLATDRVAHGLSPAAVMHGPTFMANPLACAVAAEATTLALEGRWRTWVPVIEERLQAGLAPARELPGVADVRVLGAIGVIEMERDVDMVKAIDAAMECGVWLRPFGRLIYAMPPFVSTPGEVDAICAAMVAAARATVGGA